MALGEAHLPPGPFQWPIIGNIFQMGDGTRPLYALFADFSKTYGPLFSLKLGSQITIVASSPAAAREILKTHDRSLSGRHVTQAAPIHYPFSVGFSADCGESWKYIRSLWKTELLSLKAVEAQASVREQKVKEMVLFMGSKEGEVVDVGTAMYACVLNVLTNTLFSVDFLDFEGKGIGEEVREGVTEVGELINVVNVSDLFPIVKGLDLQRVGRKRKEALEKVVSVWKSMVEQRRKQRMMMEKKVALKRDFLDLVIDNGFNDGQINQFVTELIVAGTETSISTLEWAMSALMKNQNALHKLQNELETKIDHHKQHTLIKDSHILHLPYLEACIKETLRLHPAGPLLLPHKALETCQVMGFTIPKDSAIFVNMWAIARDPNLWEQPLEFEPQRFLEKEMEFVGSSFEYLPFSAGRRVCLGVTSAIRQISLILASLVHYFEWSLPNGMDFNELDMTEKSLLTLRRKVPLKLVPKVRNPTLFEQLMN
ncbi:putative (S)-N-methylcoclaurine 3'-hydroxylase isozyme 2 [Senna tora]|uniref:Putative (S)-N-methylcoclaurine 3'-hydroxylase isozyme 2 n=1 Tax=Senna tora TaxID=362788 RepID=A0A834T113_9FABA|nr:putative (S)-N-methylcoclaurine 3'-hydroxylase isozyme 2 [Senna tora]